MGEIILETNNLRKVYGGMVAVDDVSFTVTKGQVLGVIGANGSGKSTLFGMLLGLRKPTGGSFKIFGEPDVEKVRPRMGVIMDEGSFYKDFSARKNLMLSAAIKGIGQKKVSELLEKVGLENTGSKPFKNFSYGMRKRLEIADALLTDPELVIMDEPTNGLDPDGILFIREMVLGLHAQGKTLILSSHYLDEIEKVCTHFLLMRGGKIAFYGTKEEVNAQHSSLEQIYATKF